jgi:hypothetical protein
MPNQKLATFAEAEPGQLYARLPQLCSYILQDLIGVNARLLHWHGTTLLLGNSLLLEEALPLLLPLAPRLLARLPSQLSSRQVVGADHGAHEGAHAHGFWDRPRADARDEPGGASS